MGEGNGKRLGVWGLGRLFSTEGRASKSGVAGCSGCLNKLV